MSVLLDGSPKVISRDQLSNEEYHALDAIGKSMLDEIEKSPKHYWAKYKREDRKPKKPTKEMEFGSAFHALVEDEAAFKERYTVLPSDAPPKPTSRQREAKKPSPATVAAIEWWDKFENDNAGKKLLSLEDHAKLYKMRDFFFKHETLVNLVFKSGVEPKFEHTFIWYRDGRACKCRVDIYVPGVIALDTKVTHDASLRGFEVSMWNFKYHRSAAWYRQGIKAVTGEDIPYGFVCIEDNEDWFTMAYHTPSELALRFGLYETNKLFRKILECEARNEWPGYPVEFQEADFPSWVKPRVEAMLSEADPELLNEL